MFKVETFEARAVNPMHLLPEDASITELAHVLAMVPRFMGHCAWHYSIAQHALLCSLIVPEQVAPQALLWSAPAAYLGEPFRPMATCMRYEVDGSDEAYHAVANRLRRTVFLALGLPYPGSEQDGALRLARLRALWTERATLLPGGMCWNLEPAEIVARAEVAQPWANLLFSPGGSTLRRISPEEAESLFLARAGQLNVAATSRD